MPLNKSALEVNFTQGLDTKTDPFQVPPGKFLRLQNSIFDKAGRLTKRNGFGALTALPDSQSTFLTTFNGNLTAIGKKLQAYSTSNRKWLDKGTIQPVSLTTLPLIRSNTNQSQADSVIAANGLICTVFTDFDGTNTTYKYAIADSITGQNVVAPIPIPVTTGTVTGSPRVFLLGTYFIIVFTNVITATNHLQYIAISTANPTIVTTNVDIASSYVASPGLSFDCIVVNNSLYVAWNSITGGQSIKYTYLSNTLILAAVRTLAGQIATLMSMTADITNPSAPIIWAAYYDSVSTNGFAFAIDTQLNIILAPTAIIMGENIANITGVAKNAILQFVYEINNNYSYDSSIPTHYIQVNSLTQSGTLGTASVFIRSLGLASKAFLIEGNAYVVGVYNSPYQPSYFLLNSSGQILNRLAYSNGGPYYQTGLPNVTVSGAEVSLTYLIKDLVQAANKSQTATSAAAVYSQTGINLVSYDLGVNNTISTEIGDNLNLSGGFISGYDGYNIVEQNFFVWPDSIQATIQNSGGHMIDQQYFYQVTYEWSDNQGNMFRSAPSLPLSVLVATGTGNSSVVLHIPTLRLTYKTSNPVKIVVYRRSTAQQVYYQSTTIIQPVLNNTAIDSVNYTDPYADASIIGNNILYTTGGVLENIAPPSSNLMTLFNNRLWLVDAEDRNLLWFSKQVIKATPVEMTDLQTIFVAPSTASQGSTGPISAVAPMDDKLIVFKQNSLGYIGGIGPDATGANSQYSDYIMINSVVGCDNQRSIVFTPNGLMFESKDKGIWVLGRDLSTQYIGAPVETYTQGATVLSALNVAGTNQIRFTLDTGITLVYDYYFGQWGTFNNIPAISSTLYNSLHTYVNTLGQVFQETPGAYLDNSAPVLLSFTSGWMNLAGVQGFERFYEMELLGRYLSPFKLNVQLAYDYNPSIVQATIVTPTPPGSNWGGQQLWGSGSPWGGPSSVFEARIFPQIQKCESFQITIDEVYDGSYGIIAGAGLTLSGLNLVAGLKKGYRTSTATRSFG